MSRKFDIPGLTIGRELIELDRNYLGEYYEATHSDGTKYIIKFGTKDVLLSEYSLQIPVDGILKIHQPYFSGMKMAIQYESPCQWRTLKTVIDSTPNIPEQEIISWVYDILGTLSDLQDLRIYHNNLCLEGSLHYSIHGENHIKLTGLKDRKNLSPMESRVPGVNNVITPCSSPEQLNGSVLNRTSDIWCLGVMIYYACCHKYPFGSDTNNLFNRHEEFRNPENYEPLPREYPNLKDLIGRHMLKYDQNNRKSPSELLKLNLFTAIAGNPIKPGYVMCRGNNADFNNNYDGGIYQIGQIAVVERDKVYAEWISGNKPGPFPMNKVELCTRNLPDTGLLPLTVGTKVIRGPDWDDAKHGTNDSNGAGTVVRIIPGFDLDFNTVNVLWKNRVVRYCYGIHRTIPMAEILPAYPPIVPGMKVHNLSSGAQFNGVIKSVSDSKDTAVVILGPNNERTMSYGKDDKFDFTIDKSYYQNYSVQSVESYIKNHLEDNDNNNDDEDDEETQFKVEKLDEYRKNQNQLRNSQIEVGMFVLVPPEIKNCLFCRVIGKDGDRLSLIAVCGSYTVPVTKEVTVNKVRQCTYGTPTHLPIPLNSKIITEEGENGDLHYITSPPPPKGIQINNPIAGKSWKYGICKMSSGGYQCFRFGEIKQLGISK